MKVEYREERTENQIRLLAYADQKETGWICALTDGHEWAMIYEVWSDETETKKGLIRELVLRLPGQEIFVTVKPDELDLYEELKFIRSKNAFTYIGEELNEEQEKKLTEGGLFLPVGFKYETEFEPFAGSFPVGKKSQKTDVIITYSREYGKMDYTPVNTLLENAFGGERNRAVTADAFLRSDYVQYAYDKDRLVGCARAISDGNHALVLNVAVDPEYQGLSIGRKILKHLADQMGKQNIFLNTHPGGVGFYNRKGFLRNKTALMHLAHKMPKEIKKGFCLPVGYRFPDEKQNV